MFEIFLTVYIHFVWVQSRWRKFDATQRIIRIIRTPKQPPMWRVFHGVSCPWGELSTGRVVYGMSSMGGGGSCPWGELSMGGRAFHRASCHVGKLSSQSTNNGQTVRQFTESVHENTYSTYKKFNSWLGVTQKNQAAEGHLAATFGGGSGSPIGIPLLTLFSLAAKMAMVEAQAAICITTARGLPGGPMKRSPGCSPGEATTRRCPSTQKVSSHPKLDSQRARKPANSET